MAVPGAGPAPNAPETEERIGISAPRGRPALSQIASDLHKRDCERYLAKVEVAGSSPVTRSDFEAFERAFDRPVPWLIC